MFFMVYRITDMTNGKIYVGKHMTEDLDDGYMGSGTYLLNAIRKYGRENFKKEILALCESEQAMNELEASIVTEDFVSRKDVYNIAVGGHGGNTKAGYTDEQMQEYKQKISKARSNDSEETKRKRRESMMGQKRSLEARQKMSAAKTRYHAERRLLNGSP